MLCRPYCGRFFISLSLSLSASLRVEIGWGWIGFDGFWKPFVKSSGKSCRRAGLCVEWPCAGCNRRNTTAGNGTESECLGEGTESTGSNA